MVGITDVARLANVSVATVSRVLNGHSSVREETRRKVHEAMAELGYLPNKAASGLARSRTRTIGLAIPDISSPAYQQLIGGVQSVLNEHGYSLVLSDSRNDEAIQAINLRHFFEMRVDALIVGVIGAPRQELEYFVRAGIPVLSLHQGGRSLGVERFVVDIRAGVQAAMEYLAGLRHRRVALLTPGQYPYSERADYFRENLLRLGLPYEPSFTKTVEVIDESTEIVVSLLSRPNRPTAILCGTHNLLPHVLAGVHRTRLAIPHDLSLITLVDSAWSLAYPVPLTAVTFDSIDRGRRAAQYILARLTGEDGLPFLTTTTPELIVRESCSLAPE